MADQSQMCTFKKIQALQQQDICAYADQHCNVEQMIRFSYFYYCQVNQNILVLDLLTILVPFISFRLLSQTSEYYLSPSLAKLAKCFRLSQTLAGVTLLALGNGGPDVITAIIAGNSGDDSISIAVGSIFGAGLFVTTYTLANCIQNAGQIKIQSRTFFRDQLFYLIGCLVILIYTIIGEVTLSMSIGFISIYIIFLLVVVYQDKTNPQKKESEDSTKQQQTIRKMETMQTQKIDDIQIEMQIEQMRNDPMAMMHRQTTLAEFRQSDLPLCDLKESNDQDMKDQENKVPSIPMIIIPEDQEEDEENGIRSKKSSLEEQQKQQQNTEAFDTLKRCDTQNQAQTYEQADDESSSKSSNDSNNKDSMTEKYENFKQKLHEMSVPEKILALAEIPIDLIRYFIIPPAEDSQWNKIRAIVCCYTSPIVFLLCFGGITMQINGVEGFYVAYLLLAISFVLSIIVFFFTKKDQAPCFQWLFSLGSIFVAIAILSVIAQVLVDFINFFQLLTSMNKTFLGMTLLALGNSATDFFTNSQLAKVGYGVMALTGCFAGQAFDLYLGFGFALVFSSYKQGFGLSIFTGSNINDWFSNSIAITILVSVIISTIIILICSIKQNYNFEKGKFTSFIKNYYLLIITICIGLCAADQFFE
ncbi:sodium calcium exchanger protein (macronuclear) [Tetrahymena thermophila SB210]|uniref:Sodium calcium exchanger protein n=1 Tax=Tetrahymena thermophila (strain SB210) TaxID=312017 RepID=Q22KE3_TETTS|nr:sodium calcium exchanger protein [Tetrahymena thermophila SB210]EAR85856.3 sodium calcium exchanger protein [Tetrahymena thermophila SB210]|eukprot:XP_001033519.3 sodium calcium exchanger protein [Tetrahymena thermophila SB210]